MRPGGKRMSVTTARLQEACDRFMRGRAVGEAIMCWPGTMDGKPQMRWIVAPGAYALGNHTAVVQVRGGGGCIALSHVDPDWYPPADLPKPALAAAS